MSEIAEQLGWLTSALQPAPTNRDVMACCPSVCDILTRVVAEGSSKATVLAQCRLRVQFRELQSCHATQGSNWTPSHRKPVLIRGYPILLNTQVDLGRTTSLSPCLIEPCSLLQWDDLRILRLSDTLRNIMETIPKTLIRISPENDTSTLNATKLALEKHTDYLWDWWPLRNPLYIIQSGMWRIEWTVSELDFAAKALC